MKGADAVEEIELFCRPTLSLKSSRSYCNALLSLSHPNRRSRALKLFHSESRGIHSARGICNELLPTVCLQKDMLKDTCPRLCESSSVDAEFTQPRSSISVMPYYLCSKSQPICLVGEFLRTKERINKVGDARSLSIRRHLWGPFIIPSRRQGDRLIK